MTPHYRRARVAHLTGYRHFTHCPECGQLPGHTADREDAEAAWTAHEKTHQGAER